MKSLLTLIVGSCALICLSGFSVCVPYGPANRDRVVQDFSLENVDGTRVSLQQFPDAPGFIIVFTCNHCPFAKLYPQRLDALHKKYAPLHVPLIAVNSVDSVIFDDETLDRMREVARDQAFSFPYLQDATQAVARNFGADKTPHAFVIWKVAGQWVIRYNGAIDDNGAEPALVRHAYVEDAVDALLAQREPSVVRTASIGCAIKMRRK